MSTLTITVPGEPRGKGRPRIGRIGNFARMYQPKETVSYENWIKTCYLQQRGENAMIPQGTPVAVELLAYYQHPASWSQKKKLATRFKATKPDCDNIVKCLDALNGIAWHDDAQIWSVKCIKLYGVIPRLEIKVIWGEA